jgi:hypothetical protein
MLLLLLPLLLPGRPPPPLRLLLLRAVRGALLLLSSQCPGGDSPGGAGQLVQASCGHSRQVLQQQRASIARQDSESAGAVEQKAVSDREWE